MSLKSKLRKIAKFILTSSSDRKVTITVESIQNGSILKGRNILITGGGSGIGKAIAKKTSSEGANVVIVGRNKEKLAKAAEEIKDNVKYIVFDVTKIDCFQKLLEDASKKTSNKIDTLICSAGVSLHEGDYKRVTPESFDKQFDTNFKSIYFLIKTYLDYLEKEKIDKGNIIVISSETGDQCYDIPYGLTKSALNSYVRAISRRVYKKGVRINAIAPGVTASEMTKEYADISDGNYYRDCASDRIFLPEEVAEVACFLVSNASICISGEIIHTNAGNHLNPFWEK